MPRERSKRMIPTRRQCKARARKRERQLVRQITILRALKNLANRVVSLVTPLFYSWEAGLYHDPHNFTYTCKFCHSVLSQEAVEDYKGTSKLELMRHTHHPNCMINTVRKMIHKQRYLQSQLNDAYVFRSFQGRILADECEDIREALRALQGLREENTIKWEDLKRELGL